MPSSDCIYTGSLTLGQDKLWKGESIITGLCLYTDNSSDKSQIRNVSFQLRAITNLTAIKLFTLSPDRYKAVQMNEESKLIDFLAEVFNEEFNLCGTTKNALLIQVNNHQEEEEEEGDEVQRMNMVLYGEKADAGHSISVYAHPLMSDTCYFPAYEMAITTDDAEEKSMSILDEIFGMDHVYKHREMMSSADMMVPVNRYTEIEMFENLHSNNSSQNNSSDIITSAMAARKATHNRRHHIPEKKSSSRSLKSVPSKYVSTKPIPPAPSATSINRLAQEEKKNMIRKAVKEELTKQGKHINDEKELYQQVYTNIRYYYRDIVNSITEIDQDKLNIIVKMNVDFHSNMENIMKLL